MSTTLASTYDDLDEMMNVHVGQRVTLIVDVEWGVRPRGLLSEYGRPEAYHDAIVTRVHDTGRLVDLRLAHSEYAGIKYDRVSHESMQCFGDPNPHMMWRSNVHDS